MVKSENRENLCIRKNHGVQLLAHVRGAHELAGGKPVDRLLLLHRVRSLAPPGGFLFLVYYFIL